MDSCTSNCGWSKSLSFFRPGKATFDTFLWKSLATAGTKPLSFSKRPPAESATCPKHASCAWTALFTLSRGRKTVHQKYSKIVEIVKKVSMVHNTVHVFLQPNMNWFKDIVRSLGLWNTHWSHVEDTLLGYTKEHSEELDGRLFACVLFPVVFTFGIFVFVQQRVVKLTCIYISLRSRSLASIH